MEGADEAAQTAEHRDCPVCGTTDAHRAFSAPAERLASRPDVARARYDYVRCPVCEATYIANLPDPEVLRSYYEAGDYHIWDESAPSGASAPARLSTALRAHMRLARPLPPRTGRGRHLDFGCGPGHYLAYAAEHGWQGVGIEYSERSAQPARRRGFPVKLHAEMDQLQDGSFDLVSAIHVIEHVFDPVDTICGLARKVATGGLMFLEIPYLECHEFGLFKTHFSMIQAPVHLQFFTDRTIKHLAEAAGMRVQSARNNSWTPAHGMWSALNLLEEHTPLRLSRRRKIAISMLTFPFAVPFVLAGSLLGARGLARQYWLAPAQIDAR